MSLHNLQLVASSALKLVLWVTQCINRRNGLTSFLSFEATPLWEPNIIAALSEPNPTNFSKSKPHYFKLVSSISYIILESFLPLGICNKTRRRDASIPSSNKSSKHNSTKWHVIEISMDSSIIILKYWEFQNLLSIFLWIPFKIQIST